MFFDNWFDLLRILVVGSCAYAGLVLLLRVSGKRTLSKMNAFDLVVTVALGSTLASVLLTRDISLAEGLFAFALLCTLQFIVAFLSVRWPGFQRFVKAEPALLFFRGEFLRGAMRTERVSEEEVIAAIRAQGIPALDQVGAVILETDGTFSVLTKSSEGSASVLQNVQNAPAINPERSDG